MDTEKRYHILRSVAKDIKGNPGEKSPLFSRTRADCRAGKEGGRELGRIERPSLCEKFERGERGRERERERERERKTRVKKVGERRFFSVRTK